MNSDKEYIIKVKIRWALVFYDLLMLLFVYFVTKLLWWDKQFIDFSKDFILYLYIGSILFLCRYIGDVYKVILRYGGVGCYIRLFVVDIVALFIIYIGDRILPLPFVELRRIVIVIAMNLLGALLMRLVYRYSYRYGGNYNICSRILGGFFEVVTGERLTRENSEKITKIRIAVIGAGRLGVSLVDELLNNDNAYYKPVCFVDMDKSKQGREILGLPVVAEDGPGLYLLQDLEVSEVVFAITHLTEEKRDFLYHLYNDAGYKIKTYDYPIQNASKNGKRSLRDFDVEELLFRRPIVADNELISTYYENKVVLITGGGGSIGSELCRQLARMSPKQIVILDIYENGIYDVQQELKIVYGEKLNLQVEICSITNKVALRRVFELYSPQIVINAAAHKHVPLMEHNVIEAVENNVFGSLNVVECCEQYGVERMMTVSTDKAVNPTNVMGATKRMCEIIGLAHSKSGSITTFTATRFGNVLGSAGSVIPLFKRQIANGGPVTITDRRIIRYFMTIPEASQLVLQSGAMAKNGELFVLDMGQPVKILDLAENMIRLSGFEPYKDIDIVETGLRPGEKLYEELLVKRDSLHKTTNELIFIERDEPISLKDLNIRLSWLKQAIATNSDEAVREAMHKAVPSFKTPEEVNRDAVKAEEMRNVKIT